MSPPASSNPPHLAHQPSGCSPEKALLLWGRWGGWSKEASGSRTALPGTFPSVPTSFFRKELPKFWGRGTRSPMAPGVGSSRRTEPRLRQSECHLPAQNQPPRFCLQVPFSLHLDHPRRTSQGRESLRPAVWFLPFPLPLSLGAGEWQREPVQGLLRAPHQPLPT